MKDAEITRVLEICFKKIDDNFDNYNECIKLVAQRHDELRAIVFTQAQQINQLIKWKEQDMNALIEKGFKSIEKKFKEDNT